MRFITLIPPVKVTPTPYDAPSELKRNNRDSSLGFEVTGVPTGGASVSLAEKFVVDSGDAGDVECDPSGDVRLSWQDTAVGGAPINATHDRPRPQVALFAYTKVNELQGETYGGWAAPTVSRPFSDTPPSESEAQHATWESGCSIQHTPPSTDCSPSPVSSGNGAAKKASSNSKEAEEIKNNMLVDFHLRRKKLLEELERQRAVLGENQSRSMVAPSSNTHDEDLEHTRVSSRKMQLVARSNVTGPPTVRNDFIFNQVEHIISETDAQHHRLITGRDAVHERIWSYVTAVCKTLAALWICDWIVYGARNAMAPESVHSRLFSSKGMREEVARVAEIREAGGYADKGTHTGAPLTKAGTREMISSWLASEETLPHQRF